MAASLVGPALHELSPVQAAKQLLPRQVTAAPQLLAPEQVTVAALPPAEMSPLQLWFPSHAIWQPCEVAPPH